MAVHSCAPAGRWKAAKIAGTGLFMAPGRDGGIRFSGLTWLLFGAMAHRIAALPVTMG